MGTNQYNNKYNFNPNNNNSSLHSSQKLKLSKSLFDFLYVIGRGGFGKVWKVLLRRTSKHYALKEMSKMKIVLKRSEKSIQSERELLSNLYHPFIVNMISAFQDFNNLYLVMDLFKGGDMRYHIFLNKKFNEIQSKFFIANIILGLEYIHKNKIIHRDIKPENLVLDQNGYLAITDFGIAKKIEKSSLPDASGTPGYMAPEVLFSQIHSFSVDFYAVGVIAFEFMKGFRPYQGKDRKEIKEAILAREICIGIKSLKTFGWSYEGGDFINKMIKRKVKKRLGYYGIGEIKNHPWFKNINWNELLKKKVISPYIPNDGDNFDKKFCEMTNEFYKDINIKEKYNNIIGQKNYLNLFKNYTFLRTEEKNKIVNEYYFDNNNLNVEYNNNINKELRKSLSKIIQTNNKKNRVKIMDNNYYSINDENKNILNYNSNNNSNNIINDYNNKLNKNKTINYFYPSPKNSNNNRKIFRKKRVSSKDSKSKINSLSKNKNNNSIINNSNNYNNKEQQNNIIIINPYYNQNINYYQEKEKPELNYNYNTIDVKNIRKKNNNKILYEKNLSPKLRVSSSMKTIKNANDINNNIDKENIIYSPPHILSPKFKSTRNNSMKNKISYGTLDNGLENSEYNTINKFNGSYDYEKQMIMNKLGNKSNEIYMNRMINKSDFGNIQNNNNYFYSTFNKFYNRMTSEKMIYSSFSSKSNNNNSISKISNNNNINQFFLYDNFNDDNSISKINKERYTYNADKNTFNKSKKIKYDIESYNKRSRNYENKENINNINRKKMTKKNVVVNYYNLDYRSKINNYETINQENNNTNNIFKIKVNLIPRPSLNKN